MSIYSPSATVRPAGSLLVISLMFVSLCLSSAVISETITPLSSRLQVASPLAGVLVPKTMLGSFVVLGPLPGKQLSHVLGDTQPIGLGSLPVSFTVTSLDEEAPLVSTRQSDTAMPCLAGHIRVSTEKAEGCEEVDAVELVTGCCLGEGVFGERGCELLDEETSGK